MRIKAILRSTCAEIEEIHQRCDMVWKSALWFKKKEKKTIAMIMDITLFKDTFKN